MELQGGAGRPTWRCWEADAAVLHQKLISELGQAATGNKQDLTHPQQLAQPHQQLILDKRQQAAQNTSKFMGNWRKKRLYAFVTFGILLSIFLLQYMMQDARVRRIDTLSNMCDERARMLQDQFNVSMNHVHPLAILVSTFHHGKNPSAIDQKTFGEYTEQTSFERPLTSGVSYALRVLHSEREEFEKQHAWTIKRMEETIDQTLVHDFDPEKMDPAPVEDEYAPVIFTQRTVSHLVSIDMMSGKMNFTEPLTGGSPIDALNNGNNLASRNEV